MSDLVLVEVSWEQWAPITHSILHPWPRSAVLVDLRFIRAPVSDQTLATRWGWTLPQVRQFRLSRPTAQTGLNRED